MSNDMAACIEACAECAAACESCAAECLASPDAGSMADCIKSCNECANLCRATATATAQDSACMADMCATCATAAAACGSECAKHPDMECCVECATDCADCESQCKNMAAMKTTGKPAAKATQMARAYGMSERHAPRLLQLMQANLATPRKFEVRAAADGSEATIYLYDVIDSYWGINAADVIKELAGVTAPTIHLRINSPGGDVFDARAIATAIRGHKSKVIAHIDGLAASAATTVAIAAAEVEIAEGGFFMIHQAWSIAFGNSNDMIEMADLLEKIDAAITADYVRKTGKSTDQVTQWMADTTWFNAQEAVDNGFADRVFAGDKAGNQWDLTAYPNAPKALTEKPAPAVPDPLAENRAALERRLNLIERT